MVEEAEQVKVDVVQAEVVVIKVDEAGGPAAELAVTRKGGLRQRGVTTPFVGETPTGGERTEFLPRFSRDFFKLNPVNLHSVNLSQVNLNPVKPLSVDSIQVNPYPVPQGWTGAKDTISDSSQPRTVRCRSSHKARR